MAIALTRPPTAAIARCELTHLAREPIDVAIAVGQHRAYERLLEELGTDVLSLPPEPELPDAVFVEDTALVLDEVAVMLRPGAPSRLPEVESVARVLERYRPLEYIQAPATIDGGDILQVDRRLYVGLSGRTNQEAALQLHAIVAPFRYEVIAVPISSCLHLKSACSCVGDRTILLNRSWVPADVFSDLTLIDVAGIEPRGANTFFVGDTLVMASNFPQTRARLEATGRKVRTVDLSELQKAEAGGSCLSVVFGYPGE
jgi:dimethylargininase